MHTGWNYPQPKPKSGWYYVGWVLGIMSPVLILAALVVEHSLAARF